MGFDLNDTGRTEPQWVQYLSGRVSARFLVRPRDDAFVRQINQQYATDERLGRAGRVRQDPQAEEKRKGWMRDYLVHHIQDWDVEAGGQKAPITPETVMQLTDGMHAYLLEVTAADDLREFTVPFSGSDATSNPGSSTRG